MTSLAELARDRVVLELGGHGQLVPGCWWIVLNSTGRPSGSAPPLLRLAGRAETTAADLDADRPDVDRGRPHRRCAGGEQQEQGAERHPSVHHHLAATLYRA
jgi:hypothetical protein